MAAKGKYLAMMGDALSIWEIESDKERPLGAVKRAELGFIEWLLQSSEIQRELPSVDLPLAVQDGFAFFGDAVFNPDGTLIAVNALLELDEVHDSIRREWILAFDVSTLEQRFRIETGSPGNNPLSWTVSGQLIACGDKNVLSIEPDRGRFSELLIQAENCCCHPVHNICAFASLVGYRSDKNPALCKIHIVRLHDLDTVTEQSVAGYILQMRWSTDGTKLYVLTTEKELWTCAFPEIP